MRIYSASAEEALRARKRLRDWTGEGFLSKEQYDRLRQETVPQLRTTNIFLRVVLFFFTLIGVGAGVALFFVGSGPSEQAIGDFLLIFAVVCYGAAEFAVSQARLYRYGIEEALAVCSVAFLCLGTQLAFLSHHYAPKPDIAQSLVPVLGAVFSLWIWRRFGFAYAFLAAMICAIFLAGFWTDSIAVQHGIVAVFYGFGLTAVIAVRPRHLSDYLDETYSLAEALLWLGIYVALNLQISSWKPLSEWLNASAWRSARTAFEFSMPFYWATWVLIWCLPPIMLTRGIRRKDRFVIAVGAIASVLTLLSNKPYLGWPRHTWDPMILGVVLTGVALFLRRWLAGGPRGIRYGFTARRLSGKDKQWMNVGSAVLGLVTPESVVPGPQTRRTDFRFGGGQTGGGGAGGEF